MRARPLTDRQEAVLAIVRKSLVERGIAPTIREICVSLGTVSTNGVNDHLRALERKGYIERGNRLSRSIRLLAVSRDGLSPTGVSPHTEALGLPEHVIARVRDPEADIHRHTTIPNVRGSVVYFIQAALGGPIKIGTTNNLAERFESLQTASPFPLRVLAVTRGDRSGEQELHGRFATVRLHGEWFRAVPELVEYICASVTIAAPIAEDTAPEQFKRTTKYIKPTRIVSPRTKECADRIALEVLRRKWTYEKLGTVLGVSRADAWRVCNGGRASEKQLATVLSHGRRAA